MIVGRVVLGRVLEYNLLPILGHCWHKIDEEKKMSWLENGKKNKNTNNNNKQTTFEHFNMTNKGSKSQYPH